MKTSAAPPPSILTWGDHLIASKLRRCKVLSLSHRYVQVQSRNQAWLVKWLHVHIGTSVSNNYQAVQYTMHHQQIDLMYWFLETLLYDLLQNPGRFQQVDYPQEELHFPKLENE